MCARSAEKILFHGFAERNWLKDDALFFLEKPEFCAPSAHQILQLCKALQSKHPITKCVHAERKKFLLHHIAEKNGCKAIAFSI